MGKKEKISAKKVSAKKWKCIKEPKGNLEPKITVNKNLKQWIGSTAHGKRWMNLKTEQ